MANTLTGCGITGRLEAPTACIACGLIVDNFAALRCRSEIKHRGQSRPNIKAPQPETQPNLCDYRGRGTRTAQCSCGGVKQSTVHKCLKYGCECVLTKDIRLNIERDPRADGELKCCETCKERFDTSGRRHWISVAEMSQDCLKLVPKLKDYRSIIGVSRSGMMAASILAYMLNLPLYALNLQDKTIRHCGHGSRMNGQRTSMDNPVVIDDTVGSGGTFSLVQQIIQCDTAAVYQNPMATFQANHHAAYLPDPHILEWNVANSMYSPQMLWDMDGLICEDCPPELDDDGPLYERWLQEVQPKCLPRRAKITIATGRRRRWAELTHAWLDRHGVSAEVIFHPDGVRTFESIVDHKARTIVERLSSLTTQCVMLESDAHQARAIESKISRPVWISQNRSGKD